MSSRIWIIRPREIPDGNLEIIDWLEEEGDTVYHREVDRELKWKDLQGDEYMWENRELLREEELIDINEENLIPSLLEELAFEVQD